MELSHWHVVRLIELIFMEYFKILW